MWLGLNRQIAFDRVSEGFHFIKMIYIRTDYKDFAKRFSVFLNSRCENINIDILQYDAERDKSIYDIENTPFACNPLVLRGKMTNILYRADLVELCELTLVEQDACLLHEIGHHIIDQETDIAIMEILCDQFAVDQNMSLPLLSALYKMQDKLGVNLQKRIDNLITKVCLYRPEWTCGRYNEEKRIAIMYNLIAGFSYFFEEYSATVIGEILKSRRNDYVFPEEVAINTGISLESLCQFFLLLIQCGLLTTEMPTKEGIACYRKAIFETKNATPSWVDAPIKEKLPMDVSNAEQSYFGAIDDGKTICSCMFELTYRCSEMCIHCYNPGATRNNTEVSHRGDFKELSIDDYKRIIDDMCDHGLVKVCLSGGDPFSVSFTWELLDYLYEKEIAVDIYTNGQRITNDIKRLANYYPRIVGVSIYSGVPEDHDSITRIPGSWHKSMQVVKELYELAVPMNLKCCVMQPNLHSYYMVADIAKEYGAIPQFEINITESNEGDICAKYLRLTEEQLQVVLRDKNLALYVGKEAPNYGGQKRDLSLCSCGAGTTGFCMSPNGDLRACTTFTQSYGNLRIQSVEEILTGSTELKKWRTAVIGDYEECGKYDYCDYCNLCAGLNYIEHGDFRKPAETNCYMAKCRYTLAHKLMAHNEQITREQFIDALRKLPIEEVVLRRIYRIKG